MFLLQDLSISFVDRLQANFLRKYCYLYLWTINHFTCKCQYLQKDYPNNCFRINCIVHVVISFLLFSLNLQDYLVTSHVFFEQQRNINLFMNCHGLLALSSRQHVTNVMVWQELKFCTSQDASLLPAGYRPNQTRSFLMIIGLVCRCCALVLLLFIIVHVLLNSWSADINWFYSWLIIVFGEEPHSPWGGQCDWGCEFSDCDYD